MVQQQQVQQQLVQQPQQQQQQQQQWHWEAQYVSGSGAAVVSLHLPVVGYTMDEISCTACADR
jgi:hypothetical protein